MHVYIFYPSIMIIVVDMNNDVLWDWDPGWLGWIELGDAGY